MNQYRGSKILLYVGPSRYDGTTIRVYLYASRGNSKTGKVAGLVIVPDGVADFFSILRLGLDGSNCGACPFRGLASGGKGGCYTHAGTTPVALSGLIRSGLALDAVTDVGTAVTDFLQYRRGGLRFAALRSAVYGDAAALPVDVWQAIEAACLSLGLPILGYTHGHTALGLRGVDHLRGSHVLSIDATTSADTQALRRSAGWRGFEVVAPGARPAAGSFACPASVERGRKLTCVECKACGSDGYRRNAGDVVIWNHAPQARRAVKVALATLAIGR